MKNWKCIIGATILTPMCLLLLVAFSTGFVWVIENIPTFGFVCVFIFLAILLIMVWILLYSHCKEYWFNKKFNGRLKKDATNN